MYMLTTVRSIEAVRDVEYFCVAGYVAVSGVSDRQACLLCFQDRQGFPGWRDSADKAVHICLPNASVTATKLLKLFGHGH